MYLLSLLQVKTGILSQYVTNLGLPESVYCISLCELAQTDNTDLILMRTLTAASHSNLSLLGWQSKISLGNYR